MPRLNCPCCGVCNCTPALIAALATLEEIAGPQPITSGYRCEAHQAQLRASWVKRKIAFAVTNPGGVFRDAEPALHSQHSTGNAIDLLCPNEHQPEIMAKAKLAGFRGIGIGNGFLHLDVRATPCTWRY